jgi:hypothetical protein
MKKFISVGRDNVTVCQRFAAEVWVAVDDGQLVLIDWDKLK